MCGIAGIHFFSAKKSSFKNYEVEMIVNDLLLGIESRGRDATGIATIRGNGDIWVEKAELEATEFIKHRTGLDKRIKTILLHTRYATKGLPSENLNNHPVINGNAVIIHNGHISNDDSLFKADETLERTAEVDSEAVAALVNKHGIEKCHLALQELDGGFAVGVIDQRKPTALVLAKGKTSPLVYYKNDSFLVWASTSPTIMEAMEKTAKHLDIKSFELEYLREGEILYMDNGKMDKMEFKVKNAYVPTPYVWQRNKNAAIGSGYTPGSQPPRDTIADAWDRQAGNTEVKAKPDIEHLPKGATVPRNGTFEIRVDGRKIVYRCCFKCGISANEEYFKELDNTHYCPTCFEDEVEWQTIYDTGADISGLSDEEMEDRILEQWENEEEHGTILETIAKKFGVPAGMVDYLLFECEELMDGEVQNETINHLYMEMADVYDVLVGAIVGDFVEKNECETEIKKGTSVIKRLPAQDTQNIGL